MKPNFQNGGDIKSLKKQSRRAAILYFLNSLPAPFALLYVPSVLIVRGNATATANNVRDSEMLLRFGMAGELFSATLVIFAVLAFYSLFKAVSAKHARAMLVLMLISVPISYLNVLNDLAAITFARGPEFLSSWLSLSATPSFYSFSACITRDLPSLKSFGAFGSFLSASL
jgi:Domain of unknown function (DUF4386)